MNDDLGVDIDLSSRNGLSCNIQLTEMMMNKLRWGLEGCSRRTYSITANSLFNGGSRYLDYFRKNRTEEPSILGFGQEYNVLEIRLSRLVRSTALGRVKDVLAQFIGEYELGY